MSKKTLFMMLVSSVATAFAAESVTVKESTYSGWGKDMLAFNKQAEITGDKNFYQINLLQNKPGKNGKTETFINLSAPRQEFGFGRAPINFLNLTVNGIQLRNIQPREEDFHAWSKGDKAGATFTLNFDGAKVMVDAFMKKGSPLLFLTFRQPEKQLEQIRSINVNISLIISRLLTKNNITVWDGVYQRKAQTAVRALEQQKEKHDLTDKDGYLIFSDAKLDGSGKDNGFGPSFLLFDMDEVQSAKLSLNNTWENNVVFSLKPDFKEFRIAVWQQKNAISNQDFMGLFEKEKDSFCRF